MVGEGLKMADDLFGFLNPNVPRALTPPEGYEGVHRPGMSWARQGDRKENTSWLEVDQYNHIIAQFRGLATLAGVDVSDLLASSPLLLRTFITRTIEAILSGVDLGDDYLVMRKQEYDANNDGKVDLAAGGTGVAATDAADLRAKLGITAAIDTAIQALGAVVVNKGSWSPASGGFPGGGSAKNGWAYIASIDGTVDGVDFKTGDRVLALADNASTATYAGNWLKLDYTDQVLSVAGLTGAISASALAAALTMLMPKSGGTMLGGLNIQTGDQSYISLRKGGSGKISYIEGRNGSDVRWQIHLGSSDVESGSDTGSDFLILRCGDTGTYNQVMKVDRKTGGGSFGNPIGGDGNADGVFNFVDLLINGASVKDALVAAAKSADLASTGPGKGAALVGVEPIAALPAVENVQDALATLAANAGGVSAKAWVNFNGMDASIRGGFNVSSVTRNAAGDYTINFTSPLASSNYAAVLTCGSFTETDARQTATVKGTVAGGASTKTVSALRIVVGSSSSGALNDNAEINVVIMGG
jgi:hypothetical protein